MAIPEQSRRAAIRRVHLVALAGHTLGSAPEPGPSS